MVILSTVKEAMLGRIFWQIVDDQDSGEVYNVTKLAIAMAGET